MIYQNIEYDLSDIFKGKSLRLSRNLSDKSIKTLVKLTSFYSTEDNKLRAYIIKNDLSKNDLTCLSPNCENMVKFNSYSKGFVAYCCPKHANNSEEFTNSQKKSFENIYGEGKNNFNSHITNFENFNNKEFIENNFIKDNHFERSSFIKYFNCAYGAAYRVLKELNIKYTKTSSSQAETEIINFIDDNSALQGDRELINRELDILVPGKFAIEYHSLMFHSHGISKYSMFNNPLGDRKRHVLKTNDCESKNIQLYQIFENEWCNKRNIWESVINSKLNKTTRIFARKCIIKEVGPKESKNFEESNHLQGSCSSKIRYGLYYDNVLVSLMTFVKSRMSKNYEYELLRFCSKLNTTIVGGASKLLKHFEREIKPKSLVSYANRRWSTGNLYKTIGFEFSHVSEPNYFYFHIKDQTKLYSRNSFQKHKLKNKLDIFDDALSETKNMYNNDYRKIYDAGNLVFIKNYKEI